MNSKSGQPNLLWWEKTVEYAYLSKTLPRPTHDLFPFAGPLERDVGDALAKKGENFGIIEFKRDEASIPSENKKFVYSDLEYGKNLQLMRQWGMKGIESGKEPHVVIFGKATKWNDSAWSEQNSSSNEGRYFLDVVIKDYWKPKNPLATIKMIDCDSFTVYSKFLAMARKPSENGSFGGGVAIGYDRAGQMVSCIDLEQLLDHLYPKRRLKAEAALPGPAAKIPGLK